MEKKYKNNFITEVVLRIDFETSVDLLRGHLPENMERAILKYLPDVETKDLSTQKVSIEGSPDKVKVEVDKFKQFTFYGSGKKNRLSITRNAMFSQFKLYFSYEKFVAPFLSALSALHDNEKEIKYKRIGLRYINNIKVPGDDPLDWSLYLKKNLLSIFDVLENKKEITRAFHILESNDDDFSLKFQYGMHNPDYPSQIRQKIFVLDFDAYKTGSLTQEDVVEKLAPMHNKIEGLFEKCITKNLRSIMNG